MSEAVLTLDGSQGEGGGQILRTALSLSCLTGRPFRIDRIRAGRDRPGLQPQHLAAVRALARVCAAGVEGDAKGSQVLEFHPGTIRPGLHAVDIGTAGSVTLLFHALVYPLALAPAPSTIEIVGGTHVSHSPGHHDLEWGWSPWLAQAGLAVELELRQVGFYPAGGGEIAARIPGGARFRPLDAAERGEIACVRVVSGIGRLPLHIAERQRDRALERLRRDRDLLQGARTEGEIVPARSRSPGTFVTVAAELASGPVTFTALGAKGKPAERVADEACDALFAFLATRGVVDGHLADQLVLPMALAEGGSRLRIERVTRHLTTNLDVVRRFLGTEWRLDAAEGEESALLEVQGRRL